MLRTIVQTWISCPTGFVWVCMCVCVLRHDKAPSKGNKEGIWPLGEYSFHCPVVANRRALPTSPPPRRNLAMSGEIFAVLTGEGATGIQWTEARGSTSHPTVDRTAPQRMISSAEVNNSWGLTWPSLTSLYVLADGPVEGGRSCQAPFYAQGERTAGSSLTLSTCLRDPNERR